jgi:hypothetical protein
MDDGLGAAGLRLDERSFPESRELASFYSALKHGLAVFDIGFGGGMGKWESWWCFRQQLYLGHIYACIIVLYLFLRLWCVSACL